MERKIELATVFRERKNVLCCLQEIPKKMKKMFGFTEVQKGVTADHDKSKMQVQTINKGKYIKSTKCGEHYHPTL